MEIISGAQTGADQAGWRAARAFDLDTGGWMPKGFITEGVSCQPRRDALGDPDRTRPVKRRGIDSRGRDCELRGRTEDQGGRHTSPPLAQRQERPGRHHRFSGRDRQGNPQASRGSLVAGIYRMSKSARMALLVKQTERVLKCRPIWAATSRLQTRSHTARRDSRLRGSSPGNFTKKGDNFEAAVILEAAAILDGINENDNLITDDWDW